MTSAQGRQAVSAEDRLSLLIDRLLASMDAAASTGAWDRVVELADDVLAVDPHEPARRFHDRTGDARTFPARRPAGLRQPGLRRHRPVDRHGRRDRAGGRPGRLRPLPPGGGGDHRGAGRSRAPVPRRRRRGVLRLPRGARGRRAAGGPGRSAARRADGARRHRAAPSPRRRAGHPRRRPFGHRRGRRAGLGGPRRLRPRGVGPQRGGAPAG